MQETDIDALNWIRQNLKIKHKQTGQLVRFDKLNSGQLSVWNTLQLQWSRGIPVRALIVKARQRGVSTLIEAILFNRINIFRNRLAQIVSADLDSTNLIFNMSKLFQEEMPKNLQLPTDYSSKKEITYSAPHRSRLMIQTAGKDVLGRGGTVQYFHASEAAFWPDAKKGLGGALQQVPKSPDTIVILESTGNGVGGDFYERYIQAVDQIQHDPEDYTGYLPIFLAWHTEEEYRTPLGKYGITPYSDHETYGDEKALIAKYNVGLEQLYWRRLTIRGECGGDLSLFKQEYPADWREAFQTSGKSVFNQTMLARWAERAKVGRTVWFVDGNQFRDVDRRTNCWQIWHLPEPGHEYAHGIDTCEGKASDTDNIRSDTDYHGCIIYDRTANIVAAQYRGHGDQKELGFQCLHASKFYNNAWAAPELPYGMVVLDVFKSANYPRIFHRQTHDDRLQSEETPDFGWRTTAQTRPIMVESLVSLMREDEPKVYSPELIKEMQGFERDKTGKPVHRPGEHDDLLFGFMIAVELHRRCPINLAPYQWPTTGDYEKKPAYNLAYSGAIDTLADIEEDDEWDNYTE